MGKVFIKTDVLERPHWSIGRLTSAPALVFCPLVLFLPPRCPQDKKAGAAHIWYTSTSSESLGQVPISRSSN